MVLVPIEVGVSHRLTRLRVVTHGDQTYAESTAMFDCAQQEEDLIRLIGDGVFQTGFNSLNNLFGE